MRRGSCGVGCSSSVSRRRAAVGERPPTPTSATQVAPSRSGTNGIRLVPGSGGGAVMATSLIMSDVAGTSSPCSSPSTVFFDLDDTLFDHTFSVRAGLASLAGPFPAFARHPLERLEDLYATELEAQHPRVLAGELTADAARLARFRTLGRA